MNSFFASCEVAENPELKGKKIAVAHNRYDQKGVILAASYEAKAYGVRSAMKVYEALRKCPDLIIVEPTDGIYNEYSRKFFEYFLKVTPLVEPASIDEGYLDITDVCPPEEVVNLAKKIQKDLVELYSLPCSIGIAPNKFLAKMASDMKKPLGITILRKREIAEKLWPLPIEDMIGVGKKTLEILLSLGIKTIGELANYKDKELLVQFLGDVSANSLYAHANGIGSNEVDVNRFNDVSSISNSQTFDKDEYSIENIKLVLRILINSVCNRLEKHSLKAYNFTLQLKYNNYRNTSKSITIKNPTSDERQVYKLLESIFDDFYDSNYPLRLVGVAAGKVIESSEEIRQMTIFDSLEKEQKELEIDNLIKSININIGNNLLKKGLKAEVKEKKNVIRTDKYEKKF